MHVILLADRLGQEVAPIDRRYSPALLPIAGRSVLERNLDLLVGRGVTHISLIIARDPEWFRARIADGSRWGIDLDILPMPGERDPREQIKRLGAMAALPAPVLRADVLGEAIAAGGSSLRDFADSDGKLGYFQHSFAVYDRAGASCTIQGCNAKITRIVQSGRSSFYCPACQR